MEIIYRNQYFYSALNRSEVAEDRYSVPNKWNKTSWWWKCSIAPQECGLGGLVSKIATITKMLEEIGSRLSIHSPLCNL